MSDPAAEPGAPGDGATQVPQASEKSVAAEVKKHASPKVLSLASTPDRLLLRLNKLLASPGGLSSFLSTFNYTLYLLIYLEAKSAPLQARLASFLARLQNKPAGTPSLAAASVLTGPSRVAALATLLSQTRTTLRLFGLLPMYAWFRQLMAGPKPGQDQVLFTTSVTQCVLYMTFQFLENVALLTDKGVLAEKYSARWHSAGETKTAKMYLWAYRAWMAGFCCDFVRLAREAQLERSKRSESNNGNVSATTQEEKNKDAQWYSELIVPLAWFPVGAQFSFPPGIPGFNMGVMGICGMLAGMGRTSALWAATKDE